jgi:acyl carrier protein
VNVHEKVSVILKGLKPEADFSKSADFVAEGLLDSLDLIMLVSEIEHQFGIDIPGEEIRAHNFCSVDAIVRAFLSEK